MRYSEIKKIKRKYKNMHKIENLQKNMNATFLVKYFQKEVAKRQVVCGEIMDQIFDHITDWELGIRAEDNLLLSRPLNFDPSPSKGKAERGER